MEEQLMTYLPFLIPLFILQVGLAIAAVVHIVRHPNYRFGNKVLWIIVSVLFSIIGPVVYFAFGRGDQ